MVMRKIRESLLLESLDIIDAARIEQICSVNSFALRELKVEKSQAEMQRLSGPEETPSALFTTPSFFNHSCLRAHLIPIAGTYKHLFSKRLPRFLWRRHSGACN